MNCIVFSTFCRINDTPFIYSLCFYLCTVCSQSFQLLVKEGFPGDSYYDLNDQQMKIMKINN